MSANRRGFLAVLGAALAAPAYAVPAREPFYGLHQAGIVTPAQAHVQFAAFDLATRKRADVARLMRDWTALAARFAAGESADVELAGLDPARLSVTFGFGLGLFVKDFGLEAQRPEAFVDLPHFPGEQLVPERTGGDLLIQVCADNPQVVFHVIRALRQQAAETARLRWVQSGFVSDYGAGRTARNLMGFKDGTGNPSADVVSDVVWAGEEAPAWMRGGSYMVMRRSRMALEHWEKSPLALQEQTIGRHKVSGAPLGRDREFDAVNLALLPENAHVAIAHRAGASGFRVLRRSYSYNDGANMTAERWPPWHQGMEFDAGLLFVCFQRDLRKGFIPIFEDMSRFDMMNQFVTNTGGGHWACPPGAREGDYIGRALLEI